MQLFVSKYDFQVFHALFLMQRVSQSSDLCEATATALLSEGVLVCVLDFTCTSCAQDKRKGGDIQRSIEDLHSSVIQWQQSLDTWLLHSSAYVAVT